MLDSLADKHEEAGRLFEAEEERLLAARREATDADALFDSLLERAFYRGARTAMRSSADELRTRASAIRAQEPRPLQVVR